MQRPHQFDPPLPDHLATPSAERSFVLLLHPHQLLASPRCATQMKNNTIAICCHQNAGEADQRFPSKTQWTCRKTLRGFSACLLLGERVSIVAVDQDNDASIFFCHMLHTLLVSHNCHV